MFKNLLDLKIHRNVKQAVIFYLFYLISFCVAGSILFMSEGMIYAGFKDGFTLHAMIYGLHPIINAIATVGILQWTLCVSYIYIRLCKEKGFISPQEISRECIVLVLIVLIYIVCDFKTKIISDIAGFCSLALLFRALSRKYSRYILLGIAVAFITIFLSPLFGLIPIAILTTRPANLYAAL